MKNNGACSDCGFKHEHSLGDKYDTNANNHTKKCQYSVGGEPCPYVESSVHNFNAPTKVDNDDSRHMKVCIVCSYELYENHKFDEDHNNGYRCTECDYCRHEYEWSNTENSHTYSCKYCKDIKGLFSVKM